MDMVMITIQLIQRIMTMGMMMGIWMVTATHSKRLSRKAIVKASLMVYSRAEIKEIKADK